MPSFTSLIRAALRGQLQMLKVVGLTLVPGYLFGLIAAAGILGDLVLIILRLIGTLHTTTGNLITIGVTALVCALIAAIFFVITMVQFARHGEEILGGMMDSMESQVRRPRTMRTPRF